MCLCTQPERVAWLPFPPAGPPDERTDVSTAHRLFVIGAYVEDVQACSTFLAGGFFMPLRNIGITPALLQPLTAADVQPATAASAPNASPAPTSSADILTASCHGMP